MQKNPAPDDGRRRGSSSAFLRYYLRNRKLSSGRLWAYKRTTGEDRTVKGTCRPPRFYHNAM